VRHIATLVQLVSAIPAVLGAALLFIGLFADELLVTTVMGVPQTPAGALLMVAGIALATVVVGSPARQTRSTNLNSPRDVATVSRTRTV
jgi:hypothetical protein